MSFAQSLLARSAAILERQNAHPFVTGLGDGTLTEARFRVWLVQDYLYLKTYSRALTLTVETLRDPAAKDFWGRLLALTLDLELPHHCKLAGDCGLRPQDLETAAPAQITSDYGDFLLRTARTGDLPLILASHLPCAWDYSALGQMLAERGLPAHPVYAAWIAGYADPAYRRLALELADLLDLHTLGLSAPQLEAVSGVFEQARRFELRFWDMCWQGDDC
jgi:thiaminase/transcriptional activator TenA